VSASFLAAKSVAKELIKLLTTEVVPVSVLPSSRVRVVF